MHSIRGNIMVITIVMILTCILSVFLASFLIIQSETDQNSVGMMNLINQDAGKSLEKYFENIEQSVEIASNIAIDSLDSVLLVECGAVRTDQEKSVQTDEQIDTLNSYLENHLKKIQAFFSGVADYTQGVTAYYYCIDPEVSKREQGFYYLKIGKTGFIEQPPLEIMDTDADREPDAGWYATAVMRGRPCWIGPYVSPLDETWVYSYTIPIYKAGMLIGVMGMDIPCDTLSEQIKSIRVYDTGYVCLLAEDKRVIYHPDLPIGADLDELGLSVAKDISKTESSGEKLIRYSVNGIDRQMSFSTLSNGMKLVCIAPANEINAPWIRLIRVILLITIVVTAYCVILILLLLRRVTYPLKQLTDASLRLADADYNVDLDYQKDNEIGTLTRSFKRMRDQIRSYISDLNHQIHHDRLTDLPNMRHFFSLAKEARDQMLAEGKEPAVLYFNIIGMRNYNRQFGFEKGDRLMVNFAEILKRQFGERRTCRFSGDHFAAIADEDGVEEDLREVLKICETAMDGKKLPVRVGVYPNRLEHVDVNVACDRAKYACEQNKGEIDSGITWFDEVMLKQVDIQRHIVNSLDRALSEGWVKVWYQPIVRSANGKICDEEALARWIDPDLGFLSPAYFIPALENSKLIYKLDLYVLEQVLLKMKKQKEAGFYLVPQSVNLSRKDFESCDIVEEIRRRVDDAGVDHSMITIEITESVIGSDFDFMKEQVARFQNLGFPVWMDDFGSGYSSLDVLQHIHFDLIKFDMRFMERFNEGEETKVILTELMTMAIGLGTDTVCEGVEHAEQVEFLREIGCTRIQGYYYGKPTPFEEMVSLVQNGTFPEFENPEEAGYFGSIGRINLYDMTVLSSENDQSLTQYFNNLPMSIMEVSGTKMRYIRCNSSFRDFMKRTLGLSYSQEEMDFKDLDDVPGMATLKAIVQCSRDGKRIVADERLEGGIVTHAMVRRVAVNPVTGTAAVAIAVLAVSRADENAEMNYSQMAMALAADYVDLYYVNLETEQFIEYRQDPEREGLVEGRRHEQFFSDNMRYVKQCLFKEDQDTFVNGFTKENVLTALENEGEFKLTYRLMLNGQPTYVNMKAVYMPGDRTHIIVGISNVDIQMRQKEAMSRIETEKTVYSRINALSRDYICIYVIDPATSHYTEYLADSSYAVLGVPEEGKDFFAQSREEGTRYVHPDDLDRYLAFMNRENILDEVKKNGLYSVQYRLILDGEYRYVGLKATILEEQSGPVLIIGVNDIDEMVKREQDYERKLSSARSNANLDVLTGVKNKTTYDSMSEQLTRQIEEGQNVTYAIVLSRVSDLSYINEAKGRSEGDQLIREVCEMICGIFKHSPVFRVAGDQFAVIAQGHDLDYLDSLTRELKEMSKAHSVNVAIGAAVYDGSENAASVFARAERLCMEDQNSHDEL